VNEMAIKCVLAPTSNKSSKGRASFLHNTDLFVLFAEVCLYPGCYTQALTKADCFSGSVVAQKVTLITLYVSCRKRYLCANRQLFATRKSSERRQRY